MAKDLHFVPEFTDPPEGERREFDESLPIRPDRLLRTGLNVMRNEIDRMVDQSKKGGLSGMQAHALKEYIKTASEVLKKHPNIGLGVIDEEDMDKLSDESISQLLIEAGKALKIDVHDITVQRGASKRLKEIE